MTGIATLLSFWHYDFIDNKADYAANAELVTTEAVESFGVVSGVPQSEKAAESNSNRQIYSSEENLTIVHRSNNAEYMFAPYAYAGC